MLISRSFHRSSNRVTQQGMSLIEIMLVMVLIGMVLAFVASRVIGGADRAKVKLAESQIATLAGKIDQYVMDTGGLPATLDDLVTSPSGASGWLGPYAKEAELKDPWEHPVEFTVPGENGPYDLVIRGRDGKVGGESVDADLRFSQ